MSAYKPSWFMSPMHMSPAEAVTAFKKLRAKYFIPMHYGTFDLSDEPLSLPLKDLALSVKSNHLTEKLLIMNIGQPASIK